MKRDAKKRTGGDIEDGTVVQYNMADVDCTKVDPKMLTFVVVQKRGGKGKEAPVYKLANKAGVLKDWIHQSI